MLLLVLFNVMSWAAYVIAMKSQSWKLDANWMKTWKEPELYSPFSAKASKLYKEIIE